MERLRRKREMIRSAVTRFRTKVEQELRENPGDNNSLHDLLEELIRKEESLIQLDTQIEEATDDKNLEEEISVSEEYKENINRLKRRLERQICTLEGTPPPTSSRPRNKDGLTDKAHVASQVNGPHYRDNEEEKDQESKNDGEEVAGMGTATKVAIGAAAVAGTAGAVMLAPVVLAGAGFTSAGVAAGSAAAWVQSTFLGGAIAKGGLFALCQSAGATGVLSTSTLVGVGAAGGTAAGVGAGVAAKSLNSKTESKGREAKPPRK